MPNPADYEWCVSEGQLEDAVIRRDELMAAREIVKMAREMLSEVYDQKKAQSLLNLGYKCEGVSIDDKDVLSKLEKLGGIRQPVGAKWYWLFPDEKSTREGKKLIKDWKMNAPKGGLTPGFLQHSAMPDSKGHYTKM